jgi:hypothetical protein
VLVQRLDQVEEPAVSADKYVGNPPVYRDGELHLSGITDFEASTRCHGLLAIGMAGQARSEMGDYLAWRSITKQPRSRCLKVALAELEAATADPNSKAHDENRAENVMFT